MSSDPQECRELALHFVERAERAPSVKLRQHFLTLSERFRALAGEIDRARTLVNFIDDIEVRPTRLN